MHCTYLLRHVSLVCLGLGIVWNCMIIYYIVCNFCMIIYYTVFFLTGEALKIKKSSHSKRIAKQLKLATKLAKEEEEKIQVQSESPQRKASPVRREESNEDRDEEIQVWTIASL